MAIYVFKVATKALSANKLDSSDEDNSIKESYIKLSQKDPAR